MKQAIERLDLVDEMNWEDCDKVEKIDLEEASFEETNPTDNVFAHSILTYLSWFYDGDESAYITD